jgi:hypothetical protein
VESNGAVDFCDRGQRLRPQSILDQELLLTDIRLNVRISVLVFLSIECSQPCLQSVCVSKYCDKVMRLKEASAPTQTCNCAIYMLSFEF